MAFALSTVGADLLCSDEMILDLTDEISEMAGSIWDDPAKLAQLKIEAREYLQSQTGKLILWKTITGEVHDGNEKLFLYVDRPPILSVSAVGVDFGDVAGPAVYVNGTDYWVYRDYLIFAVKLPRGHKNVTLTYHSGIAQNVSVTTAMTIARVCAVYIANSIATGATESTGIIAGPVALRERLLPGGRYAPKVNRWLDEISQWIRSKRNILPKAVGYQAHLKKPMRIYDARSDTWTE